MTTNKGVSRCRDRNRVFTSHENTITISKAVPPCVTDNDNDNTEILKPDFDSDHSILPRFAVFAVGVVAFAVTNDH